MSFYDDVRQGLLEAVEIKKGNIPMVQKEDMPAPTLVPADVQSKTAKKSNK